MGFVSGLLLFPLTGPVWGVRLLAEQLRDDAESMLRDEAQAFSEMIDLSMRHSAGQLTDSEFGELQTELLGRLSAIRDYRNEQRRAELDADDDEMLEIEIDDEDYELLDDNSQGDDDLLLEGEADAVEEHP